MLGLTLVTILNSLVFVKSLFCLLEEMKELKKCVFFKEAQLAFPTFFIHIV